MLTHIWCNVPVLGSLPDVRLQTCESVAHHPMEVLKSLKFPLLISEP